MKEGFNWKVILFAVIVVVVEFLLLLAILGEWVVGVYKTVAWIIFGLILAVGVILAVVWIIKHFWSDKRRDGLLTFDQCVKISQKVLFFDHGIPVKVADVSKAQMVFNVKHPVFFRACRDSLEEKWVFVGIRLDAVLDSLGNPDKMMVIVDPSNEVVVYDAMIALAGERGVKKEIEETVVDSFGQPVKTRSMKTSEPEKDKMDFSGDELKGVKEDG